MRTKGWKARQAEAVRIFLAKNEAFEAAVSATKRRQAALEPAVREDEATSQIQRILEACQERKGQQRQPSPGAAPRCTFLEH